MMGLIIAQRQDQADFFQAGRLIPTTDPAPLPFLSQSDVDTGIERCKSDRAYFLQLVRSNYL